MSERERVIHSHAHTLTSTHTPQPPPHTPPPPLTPLTHLGLISLFAFLPHRWLFLSCFAWQQTNHSSLVKNDLAHQAPKSNLPLKPKLNNQTQTKKLKFLSSQHKQTRREGTRWVVCSASLGHLSQKMSSQHRRRTRGTCVCMCMCVYACVCVYVCVCRSLSLPPLSV